MSKAIYKYKLPLSISRDPVVQMPRGAISLSANMQNGWLCVWALVDPDMPLVDHLFSVLGTGHPVDAMDEQGAFIGTVFDGPYVWHVFDLGDIP